MIEDYIFFNKSYCLLCKENKSKAYICPDCISKFDFVDGRRSIEESFVYYPLFYNNYIKELIKEFKFEKATYLAKPLALILGSYIKKKPDLQGFKYISYIPMDRKSEYNRGYNQAKLLAKEISNYYPCKVIDLCQKIKITKEQNKSDFASRRQNLKGSFMTLDFDIEKNAKVLVIDDVVTSGSTLGEFYRSIRENYDLDITFLVLASSKVENK